MDNKVLGFILVLIYSFLPFLCFCAIISLVASFILGSNISVFTVMKIIIGSYIFLILSLLIIFSLFFIIDIFYKKMKPEEIQKKE